MGGFVVLGFGGFGVLCVFFMGVVFEFGVGRGFIATGAHHLLHEAGLAILGVDDDLGGGTAVFALDLDQDLLLLVQSAIAVGLEVDCKFMAAGLCSVNDYQ